ncbi:MULTISPECIES: magnesium/cobalt transporter CorA [Methylomonas]|uniref:magnesium/cobalt transporter CorA n=1 Tax=Methylomonas TaxID=416 RepID=UPI001231B7F6|nr:magnesium/cobalt transporter CorA [Methylomonas rhizoryzae]
MAKSLDNDLILKGAAYRYGNYAGTVDMDNLEEVFSQADHFVWLGLRESNPRILSEIQRVFGLHELAVEDAHSAHQRPKLEEYGDSLFIVLHTAVLGQQEIEYGETHFFVGQRFLVTVRHGASVSHNKVRARCEASPHQLAKGPGFALYAIMDFIVDNYTPVLDGLQARFDALESAIFAHKPSRQTLEGLYALKRELIRMQGVIMPVIDICNALVHTHDLAVHKDVRLYFRDIGDHINRIDRAIDGMLEMLVAAMQVHLTFETVRQNEVVKRLAGWGAILAIPTMVFSLYGMNFQHMPELQWEYGYPAILGGVSVGSLLLYWRLKRSGWL